MNAPPDWASLPLLPLHTVLFPGGFLLLRVFEPRYRSMVRRCREQGTPFGVVTLLSGDEVIKAGAQAVRFHHIGTLAMIDTVRPLGTGVELLECTGHKRFGITAQRKLQGELWVADAQEFPDDQPLPIPHDLQASSRALRHVLKKMPMRYLHHASEAQWNDCSWVANRWCELLPMRQSMQLQLLALDSPLLRLELITDMLEQTGIVS